MPTIKAELSYMEDLQGALNTLSTDVSEVSASVHGTAGELSTMDFPSRAALTADIHALQKRLDKQADLARQLSSAVRAAADELAAEDGASRSETEGVLGGIVPGLAASTLRTAFTVASGIAAGAAAVSVFKPGKALALTSTIVETLKQAGGGSAAITGAVAGAASNLAGGSGGNVTFEPADSASGTVTFEPGGDATITLGQPSSGSGGTYQSNIPDWSKQTYSNPEWYSTASGTIGGVATYNYDGSVACTYYTLRKLRERGLGFPFSTAGADGGRWYDNCIDNVPKAAGESAISQLLNSYGNGQSLENLVVSFSGPSDAGHVMLIDKVFVDESGTTQITFSDNYNFETQSALTNPSGYSSVQTWTLDKYLSHYRTYNGQMKGAVLIGA